MNQTENQAEDLDLEQSEDLDLKNHPWLAPEQMALARQVFKNEILRSQEKFRARSCPKPAPKTHCARGHKLEGDNLRIYRYERETVRICVRCLKLRREVEKVTQRQKEKEALALLRRYNIRDRALVASARNGKVKEAAA